MSNHKWTKIEDALPPIGKPYLAYMPTARSLRSKMMTAIDSMSGNNTRMTIVGGAFSFDMPPITKWILLEEIVPNPEEDD